MAWAVSAPWRNAFLTRGSTAWSTLAFVEALELDHLVPHKRVKLGAKLSMELIELLLTVFMLLAGLDEGDVTS